MAPSTGTCSAPDCDRDATARGLCATHYKRELRRENGEGKADASAPIQRRDENVVLPPLRVGVEAHRELESEAKERGASVYRVAVDVLEEWAGKRSRKRK